jgi:hypothetical protein
MSLNDFTVAAALEWFGELACALRHGLHLTPREPSAERVRSAAAMGGVRFFGELVIAGRFRDASRRLNPVSPLHLITTICDKLLPRLPSGEITVPRAEKIVASSS